MWYWILNFIIAIWIYLDAKTRKMDQPILWSVGTILLMIVVLPLYFAKRPLKEGEVREGGTAWNFLKSFALFWTVTMFIAGISGIMEVSNSANQLSNEAEKAGAVIGTAIGMSMIIGLWFIVLISALIIGLFLKKSSIIERGPTTQ